MKRTSEALVGLSVLVAIALVVAGTLWLSQARFGGNDFTRDVRVRSIGGLLPGDPVLLRGVRIGRVECHHSGFKPHQYRPCGRRRWHYHIRRQECLCDPLPVYRLCGRVLRYYRTGR